MLGLALDPGYSSGFCVFSWDKTSPFSRDSAWQVTGGAEAFKRMLGSLHVSRFDVLVCEKFTPRTVLTEKSAEPLVCEGVLIGLGFERESVVWQRPASQYFMGVGTFKEKKKASRDFLRKHDLHLTGKDVGQPDADDATSATLHAIAYLRSIKHQPTLDKFFD